MEPKTYAPKTNAKEHVFQDGGSIIKLDLHASTVAEFLKQHANKSGYTKLVIAKRRSASEHATHSVYLDTWKPKQYEGSPV